MADDLDALLTAWRACRSLELEQRILAVPVKGTPLPDDRAGYDDAWMAREKEAGADGLAHLLPGLTHEPKGGIPMRLRKLLDRGPDPRLGAALLEMIDDPPVTASSNFPMWTLLFKALPTMVDTRAEKRLLARAKKKGGDSQFWPKLTAWITAAVKKLPPPAKSDGRPVPKAAAEAPKAVKAKPAGPLPVLKTLEQAAKAPPAEALALLRAVWEDTRAVAVAEAVDRLGHALAQPQPAISSHAEWMKLAKQGKPEHVTRLLEALLVGKLADSEERMAVMLDWAPDPRVGPRMATLIDGPIGARPVLWKLCYDLLVLHADPRARPTVEARVRWLETAALRDRVRAEGPHARRTYEPFLAACDRARDLTSAEAAALAAVKGPAPKAAAGGEAELLRAIAEDYAANPPRQVWGDFLTEQGDPRGEYVALAIANEQPGAKLKGKLAASQKANLQALLGPLLPLKAYEPPVFERGLLHTYAVKDDGFGWSAGPALDAMLLDLRWAQIHTLRLWNFRHKEPTFEHVFARSPLYALRVVSYATPKDLAAIAARKDFPWKLERLHASYWPEDLSIAVPSLRTLEIADFSVPKAGALTSPLVAGVDALELGHPDYGGATDLGGWLTALAASKLKRVTVKCAGVGFVWTPGAVVLNADGRFKHGSSDYAETIASLKSAPRGLAVTVTAADPAVKSALEAAVPR